MYSLMIVDSQTHCGNYPYQIPWETYGFTLTSVVKDGAEALDILRQKSIDLVITDVMPHMGGLELIQQARRLYPQVEFIIISAMAEFSYAQKALNYGVAGYCLKPIEPVELQVVLENVKNRLKRHITTVMDYFAALERFSSGSQTVDELKNFGAPGTCLRHAGYGIFWSLAGRTKRGYLSFLWVWIGAPFRTPRFVGRCQCPAVGNKLTKHHESYW